MVQGRQETLTRASRGLSHWERHFGPLSLWERARVREAFSKEGRDCLPLPVRGRGSG